MRSMARPDDDPVIQHSIAPISCAGCTLGATGWAYSCTPCGYHLHILCSQMPQHIQHPADPHHALRLLTVPAYRNGSFRCDACGLPGTGFSYHCSACNLDIHTSCASKPHSVSHHVHAHPLSLAFFPPYDNHRFSCDICGNLGKKHWLDRCAMCKFDAHLDCAITGLAQRQQQPSDQLRSSIGASGRVRQGNSVGGPQPQGVNRVGTGRTGCLMNHEINTLADGVVQQIGRSLIQHMFGGDGGSGDDGGGGDGGGDDAGGGDGGGDDGGGGDDEDGTSWF